MSDPEGQVSAGQDAPRPGLAPAEPAGRPLGTLEIDGERFRVSVRESDDGRRTYAYDWLSGPNVGYGFSSSGRLELTDEDHVSSVRNFLAQIDPATGYIGPD